MLLFYLAQWKIILVAFLLYTDCNHKNILLIFIENLIFFYLLWHSYYSTVLQDGTASPKL